MRLLLVEDDQSLSRSLSAQLEQAGYAVDRAEDGREGLYYATEYPIDLAIVDLGLPSLSGVELIRELRAASKDYPVLVLTARDRWQDKVEALKCGADDYVVKPFHVEEILARVDSIQQRNFDLLQRAGAALMDLLDAVEAAKANGATEDQLRAALELQRAAQWRLDFIAAENSMGFHAPQEAARVLGEAADYARQGQVAAMNWREQTAVPVASTTAGADSEANAD